MKIIHAINKCKPYDLSSSIERLKAWQMCVSIKMFLSTQNKSVSRLFKEFQL